MHENMIGGAVLTNWLAIVGVISLMYWAWRIVAAFQHRVGGDRKPMGEPAASAPVVVPAQPGQLTPPDEDIAVIAAAIYAMRGTHHIVHLEAVRSGNAWEIAGRWAQQTSHTPH
jgi:hypothetical protein